MSQKRLDWDPETGPEGKDTVCSSTPSLQFCELVRVRRQPPEPLDGQKRGGIGGSCFSLSSCFLGVPSRLYAGKNGKALRSFPLFLSLVQPLLFHCVVWFFLFFFFKPDRNPPVLVPSSACSPDAWRGLEGDGELI